MNLDRILSEIDLEISRLQQVKQLLSENSTANPAVRRGPGRPPSALTKAVFKPASAETSPKPRGMSAAGRARIAAAQKARWAKSKKAAKKSTAAAPKKAAVKSTGKKRGRPPLKKSAVTKPETLTSSAS